MFSSICNCIWESRNLVVLFRSFEVSSGVLLPESIVVSTAQNIHRPAPSFVCCVTQGDQLYSFNYTCTIVLSILAAELDRVSRWFQQSRKMPISWCLVIKCASVERNLRRSLKSVSINTLRKLHFQNLKSGLDPQQWAVVHRFRCRKSTESPERNWSRRSSLERC